MATDGGYRAITEFESLPGPDEGNINRVEMAYSRDYNPARIEHSCGECGTAILISTDHVRAIGVIYSDRGPHLRQSKFCDAECWANWASR